MPPVIKTQAPPRKTTAAPTPAPRPTPQQAADPWAAFDDAGLRVLVYGQGGTGKTTLAASFPGTTLWMVCSGGDKPGELKSVSREDRGRIRPEVVSSLDQFYDLLSDACGADVRAADNLAGLKCRYDNIVLDHATGFADLILSKIIGKPVPAQKSWGLASQQQYGQQGVQFKDAVRKLLSLSCNGIIIGQERTFNGRDGDPGASSDDGIKPTVGVALSPSTAGWLNTACDYVVQTFKRNRMERAVTVIGGKDHETWVKGKGVEYCLRCGPHETYQTKFRVPRGTPMPDVIVDPTYALIKAIIDGEYAAETVE